MNELLIQVFEENIILAQDKPAITPINRRFQINSGYLETINSGIFAFYPYSMLELFLILQQNPKIKGIRADTFVSYTLIFILLIKHLELISRIEAYLWKLSVKVLALLMDLEE